MPDQSQVNPINQQIPWVDAELANWGAWVRGDRLPGKCGSWLAAMIRKRQIELGVIPDSSSLADEDRAILVDLAVARLPKILQSTAKHRYIKGRGKRAIGDRLRVCERTVGVYIVRLHHAVAQNLQNH